MYIILMKNTRIISWDVGIIHLAYCVLENDFDGQTHNTTILDWDIINLMDDSRLSINCCGKMKSKKKGQPEKICGKKATYCLTLNNKHIGFCKVHLDQHAEYWTEDDTMELFEEANPVDKCDYAMKTGTICGKKAKICYEEDNYCSVHGKALVKKKIAEYQPQLIKNVATKNYPTSQLQFNLAKKIDNLMKHFAMLRVEGVVIENQPSQKNPKMKAIASTIFDCFMIRGQLDKVHGIDLQFVKMISPSNKLKVNENNTIEVFKANKDKNKKYKLTKQLSIQYTKQLLCNEPELLNHLNSFKKKDDLCDAYLHGRYYLEVGSKK